MMTNETQAQLELLSVAELRERLDDTHDPATRLALLTALGWVAIPNNVATAETYTAQAHELADQLGSLTYQAHLARNTAYILVHRDQHVDALTQADHAETLYGLAGLDEPQGMLAMIRASVYFRTNDYPQAQQHAQVALDYAETCGEERIISSALSLLGAVAGITQQHTLAISCFERSAVIYAANGYTRGLGKVHNNLGQVYLEQGRLAEAAQAAETARAYYRAADDRRGEALSCLLLGEVAERQQAYATAEAAYTQALAGAEALADPTLIQGLRGTLARLCQRQGDYSGAVAGYLRVLASPHPETHTISDAYRELAACYEVLGDPQAALDALRQHTRIALALEKSKGEHQFRRSQMLLETQLARTQVELLRLREAETRSQLEHSDRLASLGKMAASLAHEINNPLQIVYGNLLLMQERDTTPQQQAERLDLIVGQVEQIIMLVAQMRAMYQFEATEADALDLSTEIEKVLLLTQKAMQGQGITPTALLVRGLPVVHASRTQVQQVVMNLVLNAIEAMPDGGSLRLSSAFDLARHQVIVEIADNGHGIAPEYLPLVFEPFFTTRTNGTGLGLPIVQNIVKHYGGDICIASTPGIGTTVTVTFPVRVGVAASAVSPERTETS